MRLFKRPFGSLENGLGVAALLVASLIGGIRSTLASEDTKSTIKTEYQDELSERPLRVLALLRDGNQRSRSAAGSGPMRMPSSEVKTQVKAIVVSCNNPKIRPEILFDMAGGEIISVRGNGNSLVRDTVGSIEEAVEKHTPPLVLVLGDDSEPGREPCSIPRPQAEEAARAYESQSEVLQTRIRSKRLTIQSALFHLKSGEVEFAGTAPRSASR